MKKVLLIFCVSVFANISDVFGAYFYADVVEEAIKNTFPENLWEDVAAEYEAQMDHSTGEINTYGMQNVCYTGGFDVSTEKGATDCKMFVEKMSTGCPYTVSGSVYDVLSGEQVPNDSRKLIEYYTNPKTKEEKFRKCILDKTVDWVISKDGGNEGGFQQNPTDKGNRICDKDGEPKKDKKGNYLLGATNYGITTCSSGLSVECIKKMTLEEAKQYYWTRNYMRMRYYRLPIEIQALVLEMSVSGIGYAGGSLRCALEEKPGGWSNYPVMTNDPVMALRRFIANTGKTGEDEFNKRYTGTKYVNGQNCVALYQNRRKKAYNDLGRLYETCAKEVGFNITKTVQGCTGENLDFGRLKSKTYDFVSKNSSVYKNYIDTMNKLNNFDYQLTTLESCKSYEKSMQSFSSLMKSWTGKVSKYFENVQTKTREEAVQKAKKQFEKELPSGYSNYFSLTTINCVPSDCKATGQDTVTCSMSTAGKNIKRTYEFDDICDGNLVQKIF